MARQSKSNRSKSELKTPSAGGESPSKGPRRIGSVISQLMARRGYAQVQSSSAVEASVVSVVGPTLAEAIRISDIKQGVVAIHAKDSTTMQELTFQKRKILKRLQEEHPSAKITDVRLRIG